jgi:hypothetical protein
LRATKFERLAALTAQAVLFIAAAALSPATQAQVLLSLKGASIFEGGAGTTSVLRLPVTLSGVTPTTVNGFVSAVAAPAGFSFNPATPGTACDPGVDFLTYSNVPFSIPANSTSGTLNVAVTICGDNATELNEHILASFSNVTGGAFCTSESCAANGTIVNDEGAPSISIGSISVSEPAVGTSRIVSFPVTLSHPTSNPVSVHFATRNGTAKARTLTGFAADYVGNSGTLNITTMPTTPGQSTAQVNVTLLGDGIQEPIETFFVDLSSPVNATILNGTGQASIRDTTLSIGSFDLSPDEVVVENGDTVAFDFVWIVPDGENWHDLKSLDFRIGDYGNPVLWVRWDESSNTFSLCEKAGGNAGGGAGANHAVPPETCGPGAVPGSAAVLVTPAAQLFLADTTVVGSGPTGPSVTLHLVVSFGPEINAHSYPIWLSPADDFGNVDKFVRAGEISVE